MVFLAVVISLRSYHHVPLITDRSNTVLFLTDRANGLSNVYVATSVHDHYGSFAKLAPEIVRVSAAKPI